LKSSRGELPILADKGYVAALLLLPLIAAAAEKGREEVKARSNQFADLVPNVASFHAGVFEAARTIFANFEYRPLMQC
jgi:hypothetical protein